MDGAPSNQATLSKLSELGSTPGINDRSYGSIFAQDNSVFNNNEIQDKVEKYGYIFQTPEAQLKPAYGSFVAPAPPQRVQPHRGGSFDKFDLS